jgi:hypothetical protein
LVLGWAVAIRGVGAAPEGPLSGPAEGQGCLVLQNDLYRLEVGREHGECLRLLDRKGGIDLRPPPGLAGNFRICVPLGDERRNFVNGGEQALSRFESGPGALALHWAGPMKDEGGREHDLAATMRIALEGESVVFNFSVENRTKGILQEVWYPALGGLLGFGPAESRGQACLNPPPHNGKRFARGFGEYLMPYPSLNMAFVEIDNPVLNRGMYIGAHDPVARFKAFHFQEQTRGGASDVSGGLIHYPFTPAGGRFEGSPCVVRFHEGDWVAGGRQIYRPWFISRFGLARPKDDWIRQQSFYQMIMIMLPEGNINYRIREIPQLARDGLKYGIRSLQIAGWQFGGHDNGYPYYEPDPRLGTYDDLQEAIRQVHEMGVKIYFFANIHVVNMDTEWYRKELKDYNFEWVSGHPCWVAGWGMGTLGSRMGLTTPLMSFADPSFPGLADGQLKYFRKLAAIGADGIHIDKCFSQPVNFNPRIAMTPDVAPWEGVVRLVDRTMRECRALNPDWRMSYETNFDRLLAYNDATWWAGNMSIARRVFPELVETVGLSAPYDYITVNDAVRNGHVVMIDPHDFCRSMDHEPFRNLAGYIRDVKKIRDELADYVFMGEPLDSGEASFAADPPRPAGIDHAAYRNPGDGKRACILSNRAAQAGSVTLAGFGGARPGRVRILRPGQEAATAELPARISIDPERVVFVVEQ